MVLLSFLFYAWGSPKHLLLLILSILFNYGAALVMDGFLEEGNHFMARVLVIFAAAADVLVLAVFKYTSLALPVGISFYTFSILSYLFDVYREKEQAAKNLLELALYVSFFPKLTSGPIVPYGSFAEQLYKRNDGRAAFGEGINLFLIGLFKKVLIADSLGRAFGDFSALPAMTAGAAWLGMIFYSLQLYFDFSGYSDMAIGLSRIFGFRFDKNFDYPYLSVNISEFWRRWHISLGAWFRNYVYIPMGGNRCSTLLQVRNLMTVWLLTGIWHGSTWNFVFWGLYHGAFVLLERFVLKDRVEAFPRILRILVTDLIVFIGWVFFFSPSLGSAFRYIGKMFGADGLGFWNGTTGFLFRERILLLLVSVLLCGPFVRGLHDSFAYRRGGVYRILSVVCYAALFCLCVAGLVSATYTTFMYAQF